MFPENWTVELVGVACHNADEEDGMGTQRRSHSAEFKAKVALEAIKGERTANEIASQYGVHPVQVGLWKKQASEGMSGVFRDRRDGAAREEEELKAELYQQIGQLTVELDWMKKKLGPTR
jgi:transposase-like protein